MSKAMTVDEAVEYMRALVVRYVGLLHGGEALDVLTLELERLRELSATQRELLRLASLASTTTPMSEEPEPDECPTCGRDNHPDSRRDRD